MIIVSYLIRDLWRTIKGRCIVCNSKKENHDTCIHCMIHYRLCHRCGKIFNYAISYSGGKGDEG